MAETRKHRRREAGSHRLIGVSAAPGWRPLPHDVRTGIIPGSSIGIGYFGGPVIKCPQIYAGFWGQDYWADPGYQALQARLTQFLTDLPNSTFMNVLSQYGAGFGAGLAGSFIQAHNLAITGTEFKDSDITSWIQILIDFGVIPDASTPSSLGTVVMVIFLDDTIEVNDPAFLGGDGGGIVMCEPNGDTAFGYHYFFNTNSGNPMYYAVVPALDDNCLQESCPDPTFCNLQLSQTREQRLTETMSHEIAEMLSDPQPFTGWVPEIGDPCAGEPDTITVGPNTWTVQKIYSLADDLNSNGQTICVSSEPQPLPAQPGGPMASVGMLGRYRPGHLDRLLPLPTIRVDGEKKTVEIADKDLRRFVNRIAQPLHYRGLPGHLPKLLRQAADYLEK